MVEMVSIHSIISATTGLARVRSAPANMARGGSCGAPVASRAGWTSDGSRGKLCAGERLGVMSDWWPRLRRLGCALVCALVAIMTAGALCAEPAVAGVVTQTEQLQTKVRGLTLAERRALSMASVSVASDASFGLTVTVTFKGDAERYLGQGDLQHGGLVLILVPASSARAPAGLVDEGGGFAPIALPLLERHGDQVVVKRAALDVHSPEHLLRGTTARPVAVIRDVNRVILNLGEQGLGPVAAIKLKVFAAIPTRPGRRTSSGQPLTPDSWREILHSKPTGVAALKIDPSRIACGQSAALSRELGDVVSSGLESELRHQQQAGVELRAAVNGYATLRRLVAKTPGLRHLSRSGLAADLSNTAVRIHQLKTEVVSLEEVIGQLGALIKACAPAPPQQRQRRRRSRRRLSRSSRPTPACLST